MNRLSKRKENSPVGPWRFLALATADAATTTPASASPQKMGPPRLLHRRLVLPSSPLLPGRGLTPALATLVAFALCTHLAGLWWHTRRRQTSFVRRTKFAQLQTQLRRAEQQGDLGVALQVLVQALRGCGASEVTSQRSDVLATHLRSAGFPESVATSCGALFEDVLQQRYAPSHQVDDVKKLFERASRLFVELEKLAEVGP